MTKIYSLLLILVLPLLSACEGYLDKPDSDDVTVDKAFETVKSARKVLNNLYYEVRTAAYNVNTRKIPYAQACDDGLPGSGLWGDKFHSGSWTPDDDPNMGDDNQGGSPTCSFWNNTYKRVRKANLFLENLYRAKGDESEKTRMYAEARFLRAFYYSELVRRFGGIIILDHSIDANDYSALTNQPRETFENSVEWVCNELTEAARDLPPVCSASDVGRATDAACYAVMARLRITAASPLFNTDSPVLPDYNTTHYYGNYDKNRWKLAADACRFIMEQRSQYYGLDMTNETGADPDSWENYYRRFLGRYFIVGKESIWISYEKKEWDYVKIPWLNRSAGGWNWVNPTYELAKEYEMLNGKLPEEPESGYDFNDPGKNRDPRFKATISYPGAQYDAYGFKPWQGGSASHLQSQKTGMCLQKYIDPLFNDALGLPRNLRKNINHLFRYNEILLIYAEAMNEFSGPTTDVYKAINDIRARVGMPDLPTGLNQDQMREKIQHERRVELAFEDFRFFDVRRWRIGEKVLNGHLHGYDVTKGEKGGFYTLVTVGDPMVFEKKHYLYPLSTKEILMNPALEQNPGWPKLSTK